MADTRIPPSYDPLNDSEYMSDKMVAYFKDRLTQMSVNLFNKEKSISLSMVDSPNREPDHVDQGINEELLNQDFTLQEHEDKLRHEVEAALERIDDGTYGYCEETDMPIGVPRLLAAPYARYCLEVQEQKEQLARSSKRAL